MRRTTVAILILLSGPAAANAAAVKQVTLQPGPADGLDAMIGTLFPYFGTGADDSLLIGEGDAAQLPIEIDGPLKTAAVSKWRSLLQFDLTRLPADADVSDGRLRLFVEHFWPLGGGQMKISTYRVKQSWREGESGPLAGVGWIYRDPPTVWSTSGGSFTEESPEKALSAPQVWIEWDVRNIADFWAANPDSNLGFLLKRKKDGYALGSFASSDHENSSIRPKLFLEYGSEIVDDLPALVSGVAEIQPIVVRAGTTAELTLYAALDVDEAYFGMGPDYLAIKVPTGFRDPVILEATYDGAPIGYHDASGAGDLKLEIDSCLTRDGTLVVRFAVRTPGGVDPTGKAFRPSVDDLDTDAPAQSLVAGDADGIPGNGDSYTVYTTNGALVRIDLSPAGASVTADSSLLFQATGYDAIGQPVPIAPTWSVTGGIGTVTSAGLFDPIAVGSGSVRATAGLIVGSAPVSVSHGRAVELVVAPPDTFVVLGDAVPYAAAARDADGNAFVPATDWSATPAIGSIDASGVFTSSAYGAGIVVGAAEGIRDTASVRVGHGAAVAIEIDPADASVDTDTLLDFDAFVRDDHGNEIDTAVVWNVTGGIGTIDAGGVFDPRWAGSGSVGASLGPLTATAPVKVSPGDPARLEIAAHEESIAAVDSLLFAAAVYDADSNVVPAAAVAWSEPTGMGTIDASGLFRAGAAGTARIVAASGAAYDTTTVAVVPGPPASLEVIPSVATIDIEQTIDFDAIARDARGNTIASPGTLAWSGGESIGSIHPATGLFVPGALGTDTIVVSLGSVLGRSGSISVVEGAARRVEIEPASLEIRVGRDTVFVAEALDAAGNPTGEAVEWSAFGGVGSISVDGRFSASSPGPGGVVARASSLADTALVSCYDELGIRVDAVLESRTAVSPGEEGIQVGLRFTNRTGDLLVGLSGGLRFSAGGADVASQYAVEALPFLHEPLADGASDTLRFVVAVGEDATPGSSVVVDGHIAGTLLTGGTSAAGTSALAKGGWAVGDAADLVDVTRSLYPSKAYAGNSVSFAIALRNGGGAEVTLEAPTRLVFSDGTETFEAPLGEEVTIAGNGGVGTLLFGAERIPSGFDPGEYIVTLHAEGTDENGGDYRKDLAATLNPLDLLPPYILAVADPIAGRVVHPGNDSIPILRLELVNLYETARSLTTLRVANANIGPGTAQEKDGEWDLVRLIDDRNDDGVWGAGDALLGSGTFSAGITTFFPGLAIAAGDTAHLLLLGDLSLAKARDAEELDARIASAADIVFTGGGAVQALFPLNSPGTHFVDAFTAAQMTAYASFPSALPAGASDSLALDLRLPSNGYRADTLRVLTIQNAGTAAAGTDIAEVRLWRDGGNGTFDRGGGDDAVVGPLFWTGDGWTRSGINLPIPVGGRRFFLTIDATETPTDQRTVRLRVPIDGVLMSSGGDGPLDAALLSPASRIVGGAKRVVVELTGSGSGEALPGDENELLAELSFSNFYTDSVHVTGLVLENRSSGAAPDSVVRLLRLFPGAFLSGPGGPLPPPIATAPSIGGEADLAGFSLGIGPGGTRTVTVGADVSLRCAGDGDTLLVALAGAADIRFRSARSATGSFPLVPATFPLVNGLIAEQVALGEIAGGAIAPTESEKLAFELVVPSNGCRADLLEGVRVVNLGTAGAGDIEVLALRTATEPETDLGDLVWNGQMWVREGISLPVPAGGAGIRVRVTPSAAAVDGRTIRLAVPAGGLAVASANDGPIDRSVPSPALFTISTSPLFAEIGVPLRRVSVGEVFEVEMRAENVAIGEPDTLRDVRPSFFTLEGTSVTVLASPPPDATVRLAAGEEAVFSWTCRAEAHGTLLAAGAAEGRRVSDGAAVLSPAAQAEPVAVQRVPSGVNVSPLDRLPAVVTRGDRLVRLFFLSFTHRDPAGESYADVRIDTVRIDFRDGSGSTIAASSLLRGATALRGGSPIGIVDSAEVGGPSLAIPLVPAPVVQPGGEVSIEVLVDLLEETTAASFRGVLSDSGAVEARDANSSERVSASGSFPFATALAAIVVPPDSLTVTVTDGLPARVHRGASFVPILEIALESRGITGVTSDLVIEAIQLLLPGGGFPFEWARVSGPVLTHFTGDQWTREGSVLSFPLNPPIEVPVNSPLTVRLVGHVRSDAPLGSFSLGIEDTLFVDPRTQTEDRSVPVVLLLTAPVQSTVVVPADSLLAEGTSPSDTSVAYPGSRGRELFRVRFVHPGADSLGPIRADAFRFRPENAAGDSVEMRSLLAQVRAWRDGAVIATLAPLGEGSATLSVPLDPAIELDPGDSTEVVVVADIRSDADPDDYRFLAAASGIEAEDAVGGSPVTVRFRGSDEALFRTAPLRVRTTSDRIDVAIDLRLPPTSAGGAVIEDAGRFRFTSGGGSGAAGLLLSSFAVAVESASGGAVSSGEVIAEGSVRPMAGGAATSASLSDSLIVFSLDPPIPLPPGEPVELALALRVADEADLAAFRLRFLLESVGTVEGSPAVLREEGDAGSNPSNAAHLAEKEFAASLRNYPNPFASGREETTIAFYARARGRVEIRLFTGLGVPVWSREASIDGPGLVETTWDGRNGDGREVLSGVYLASVEIEYEDGSREHGIHKIAVLR